MPSQSKQAVCGLVFDEARSEVLLVKRRDIPVWVPPGGGLDPGETPEAGVVREVLEETGYTVRIVRKTAEYLPVNWMTQLTHVFECRLKSGEAKVSSETREVRFFRLDALPPLPPPYEGWIREGAAGHPRLIRKEIEGVTLWVLLKLLIQHPLLTFRYLLTKLGIHINR